MNENDVIVKNTIYSNYIKRLLDIVLSGIAILVLSPVFLVIVVLELILHGRPVFYYTKRPGKNDVIFNMIKFRSMTNERGVDGFLLPEEQRLTSFGKFIRKTSIDELPELFNIFKGDMSIVGPRPLLVEYLNLYTPRHRQRNAVRPGLACFCIIPKTTDTWTWREQFDNDIWYVEHVSFKTDALMIWAIIKEVFKASDTRADDTRVPFDGNNLDEVRSKREVDTTIRFDSLS